MPLKASRSCSADDESSFVISVYNVSCASTQYGSGSHQERKPGLVGDHAKILFHLRVDHLDLFVLAIQLAGMEGQVG